MLPAVHDQSQLKLARHHSCLQDLMNAVQLPALHLTGSAMATAAPTCRDIPVHSHEKASIHKPSTAPVATLGTATDASSQEVDT